MSEPVIVVQELCWKTGRTSWRTRPAALRPTTALRRSEPGRRSEPHSKLTPNSHENRSKVSGPRRVTHRMPFRGRWVVTPYSEQTPPLHHEFPIASHQSGFLSGPSVLSVFIFQLRVWARHDPCQHGFHCRF
jgi:hypothetical protein